MMLIPVARAEILRATGQTIRINQGSSPDGIAAFVWNPSVDYGPYAGPAASGYPTPTESGEANTYANHDPLFFYPLLRFQNNPWLVRANMKDGEAGIDISMKDMTAYVGNDVGSTPYQIRLIDSTGKDAWGFLGATGTGAQNRDEIWSGVKEGSEMLSSWSQVSGKEFDTFTATGATIISAIKAAGETTAQAISNTFTLVEGKTYKIFFGGHRHIGDANTRPELYVGEGTSSPSIRLGDISGAISEYPASYGSNWPWDFYEYYYEYFYGTLETPVDTYSIFQFTCPATLAGTTRLTINQPVLSTLGASWGVAFSLKEAAIPDVSVGGVHIVSADGGSTRNWTTVTSGFNPNTIEKWEIRTHDAVLGAGRVDKIYVYDTVNKKFAKGWLGLEGEDGDPPFPTYNGVLISGISKANPGVVTSPVLVPQTGTLLKFVDLTEMTELNGTYATTTSTPTEHTSTIVDTSGFGAAETTWSNTSVYTYYPNKVPTTALRVYDDAESLDDASYTHQKWEIESGFEFNRNDYTVIILNER